MCLTRIRIRYCPNVHFGTVLEVSQKSLLLICFFLMVQMVCKVKKIKKIVATLCVLCVFFNIFHLCNKIMCHVHTYSEVCTQIGDTKFRILISSDFVMK